MRTSYTRICGHGAGILHLPFSLRRLSLRNHHLTGRPLCSACVCTRVGSVRLHVRACRSTRLWRARRPCRRSSIKSWKPTSPSSPGGVEWDAGMLVSVIFSVRLLRAPGREAPSCLALACWACAAQSPDTGSALLTSLTRSLDINTLFRIRAWERYQFLMDCEHKQAIQLLPHSPATLTGTPSLRRSVSCPQPR